MKFFERETPVDEITELYQQVYQQKMHEMQIKHHPDCRDPDHPGCPRCEPEAFADAA